MQLVFEDLVFFDDRAIQKVLREIDSFDLSRALKISGENVKKKIFRNMSRRAVSMIKEDMEYMGPVRVADVKEAQEKIMSVAMRLSISEEIMIERKGEGELVV